MITLHTFLARLLLSLVAISIPSLAWSGAYSQQITDANNWLVTQQNTNGSWGDSVSMQFVSTPEAVIALSHSYQQSHSRLNGINWLWNHFPDSMDAEARKAIALSGFADNPDFPILAQSSQHADGSWGLDSSYLGSSLDTAIVLQALASVNETTGVTEALGYLKSARHTTGNTGWPLSPEMENTTMDPITTAMVLRALVPFDTYTGVSADIALAIADLNAAIDSSSTLLEKSHATLALLSEDKLSTQGLQWLSEVAALQNVDGSWSQDVYLTSLLVQAMAIAEDLNQGGDPEQVAHIADLELQRILNTTLQKNRSDLLRAGDMAQITTLDLEGENVQSLSGLDSAINLASLSIGVDAPTYVGSSGQMQFAGIIEDLQVLDGNSTNITVNVNGDVHEATPILGGNLIINGDFDLAQRGSGGFEVNGEYTLDRWILLSDGNSVAGTGRDTDSPAGSKHSVKMSILTANKKFGLLQIIENLNAQPVIGDNASYSFKAKIDGVGVTAKLRSSLVCWQGTADTFTDSERKLVGELAGDWGNAGTNPVYGSSNWSNASTLFPDLLVDNSAWVTFKFENIPVSSSCTNVGVFIWVDDPVTGLGNLFIDQVQLEKGPAASAFMPRQFETEVALAQRYYEKSYPLDVIPGTSYQANTISTEVIGIGDWTPQRFAIQGGGFKVEKRRAPVSSEIFIYSRGTGNLNEIQEYNTTVTQQVTDIQRPSTNRIGNYIEVAFPSNPTPTTELKHEIYYDFHFVVDVEL